MIVMLIIQTVWDCRWMRIPIAVTAIGGGIGLVCSVMSHRMWIELLLALVPGVICLLLGYLTREAIGYGDGFLLCAMGCYVSLEQMVEILVIASLCGGLCALFLLVSKRKRGKDNLPFVPFLLIGAVVQSLIQGGIRYV